MCRQRRLSLKAAGRSAAAAITALLVYILTAGIAAQGASAHELSMAVMDLQQGGDGKYTIRWPGSKPEEIEDLNPVFPEHCEIEAPVVDCGVEGLVGAISFDGLGARTSAAMFRIKFQNGQTQVHTVTVASPIAQVKPTFSGSGWSLFRGVFTTYLGIGVEHILLGVDHLLFVLGLIWIVRSRWMLLKTITSFTLAHSITLAAVTFGVIGVPERLVNALIALSIVFIGVEIVKQHRGETSLTIERPWFVAFGFGLLHGFGFANALMNLGLPENSIIPALLAFNVGVEIGQVAFVFLVLAMGWALRALAIHLPRKGALVPAYVIGTCAAFWTLERVSMIVAA